MLVDREKPVTKSRLPRWLTGKAQVRTDEVRRLVRTEKPVRAALDKCRARYRRALQRLLRQKRHIDELDSIRAWGWSASGPLA